MSDPCDPGVKEKGETLLVQDPETIPTEVDPTPGFTIVKMTPN